MPRTPKEQLERIKKAAREGKIRFAPADEVAALRPFVDRVLATIAAVLSEPRVARALVTDLSMVSDFLDPDAERREAQAAEIAKALGVRLEPMGAVLLHEVARALATREDSLM